MLTTESTVLAHHVSPGGPRVTQVRGSLLVSSLHTLRDLELFDRYKGALPKMMHEPVLFSLASSWVPVEVALAHYKACEDLNLGEAELNTMGEHVGKRIMGTFLGTIMRATHILRAADPERALEQYPRLWERLLQGGGCDVIKKGPKDALIDSLGALCVREVVAFPEPAKRRCEAGRRRAKTSWENTQKRSRESSCSGC